MLIIALGLDGEVVRWAGVSKRLPLWRKLVLHRVVRDPPATANKLVGFHAARDVGVSELLAERRLFILVRGSPRDVLGADKGGPSMKTNSRDGGKQKSQRQRPFPREPQGEHVQMVAAAFPARLLGVGQEYEMVHVQLDGRVDEVTNRDAFADWVGTNVNGTVGRRVVPQESERIDSWIVLFGGLPVLVKRMEDELRQTALPKEKPKLRAIIAAIAVTIPWSPISMERRADEYLCAPIF